MNSSYPSSTVTDAQIYDSANPPPLSSYSSSTVTDDQKHDSANPPPPSSYSSSTVTDDQKHDSANPPPPSSYSSSTLTDDQKHDSANPPPPSSEQTPPGTEVPWSTDLFSCFDDGPNCCITCCCPCITFGQISEIVDKGATTCGANAAMYALIIYFTGCFGCCFSCFYRTKMRKQYMLSESPCPDCCVHWFCEPCALCQEYRELKNRGFDMSKGWKGNLERQNHGITMAPVVEGMSK